MILKVKKQQSILSKAGIPSVIAWGYLGVFLFVFGCAIENSWFSTYLTKEAGFSTAQAGSIFSAYGITVAVLSWFSGILVKMFGVRKVMWAGAIVFLISAVPFVAWALPAGSYQAILLLYMIRGAGYPLFAYSFMIWITYRAGAKILGRATSWFWIAFNLGMLVVGPWVSDRLIPSIGYSNVLWFGTVAALVGMILSLVVNRDQVEVSRAHRGFFLELVDSIRILVIRPRLGMGVLDRVIDGFAQYAFVVILPLYLQQNGYTFTEWTSLWASAFLINAVFNYLIGALSDRIGWRITVMVIGGPFVAIACVLLAVIPSVLGHNYGALLVAMGFYGIGMSGFCPLSALVPMMTPDRKEEAVTALNLGTGLCSFVGPLFITLISPVCSAEITLFIIGAIYLTSIIVTSVLKTSEELSQLKLKGERA